MSSLTVHRYRDGDREEWDRFVTESRNGTFLFQRSYMEYHADRFVDHSILFREDGQLVAILPATENIAGQLVSHGGLTYGGIVSSIRMRTGAMLQIFDALKDYCVRSDISGLIYKAIPFIYHSVPSEEDRYALFRHGARLVRRDVASAVDPQRRPRYTKGRHYCVNKSRKAGLTIGRSDDFAGFMALEDAHLRAKFGVAPVHSAAEMVLLAGRFPENIKLFTATRQETLLGGVLIYESANVAHAQYIAASDEGKALCALDAIIDDLLTRVFAAKPWFDFGISTEQQGWYLNEGLIENKESYGARAVVYDFYEMEFAAGSP